MKARGNGRQVRAADTAGPPFGAPFWLVVKIALAEETKNITVSLDDDIYRRAHMIAAQKGTSVSALVKRFLMQLGSDDSDAERLKRKERLLRERITEFRASDRLSRDDIHGRAE